MPIPMKKTANTGPDCLCNSFRIHFKSVHALSSAAGRRINIFPKKKPEALASGLHFG